MPYYSFEIDTRVYTLYFAVQMPLMMVVMSDDHMMMHDKNFCLILRKAYQDVPIFTDSAVLADSVTGDWRANKASFRQTRHRASLQ